MFDSSGLITYYTVGSSNRYDSPPNTPVLSETGYSLYKEETFVTTDTSHQVYLKPTFNIRLVLERIWRDHTGPIKLNSGSGAQYQSTNSVLGSGLAARIRRLL